MFRYKRELILPYFLSKRMTVSELARRAGISNQTAQRAVEGDAVSAVIIGKVAEALGFNAMDYLDNSKVLHIGHIRFSRAGEIHGGGAETSNDNAGANAVCRDAENGDLAR